jgi:predicted ATPase
MFWYRLTSLICSSGDQIDIEKDSLTLLIGPNSSGKSTALAEIQQSLSKPAGDSRFVVKTTNFDKSEDSEEAKTWLTANFPKRRTSAGIVYTAINQDVSTDAFVQNWESPTVKGIAHFLCHRLDTKSRLLVADDKPRAAPDAAPADYINLVQRHEKTLDVVSTEVEEAFQKSLVVNHGGANTVWFHVGKEPTRTKKRHPVSEEYLSELAKVPKLSDEGDGIKSFVACLLGVYCGAQKILLVDEPEAFLHPPQARQLGAILANSARKKKRQIIAATHSPDIVIGALTSNVRTAVFRLDRDGDSNKAYMLNSRTLKQLWSKPLLQSTGAINGIFHKGVVVCEGDSDCRFFEALIRRLVKRKKLKENPDIYFIHGGGKGAITTLLKAYHSLNVDAIAVTDFDMLRDLVAFKNVLSSLKADYSVIEKEYRSAKLALDKVPPKHEASHVAKRLTNIATQIDDQAKVTGADKQSISTLLSGSAVWSVAKEQGIAVLKGGKYAECEKTIDFCRKSGLFIIDSGELESFWRGGPSDKQDWILDAIRKIHDEPKSFAGADRFVIMVCQHFGY